MQTEIKRRVVWFSVFMVWLGMVGAILIFQETNPGIFPSMTDQVNEAQTSGGEGVGQTVTEHPGSQPDSTQQADAVKRPTVKEESSNADFFVQYRLERDKARSDQISTFRETINNPNTDTTTKKINQEKILQIQKTIEQEMQIESLIKLQGYANALALIGVDGSSMNLVVLTNGLDEDDVAKIYDIITQVATIRAENITIIEKRINE